jgi:hypothetical protein
MDWLNVFFGLIGIASLVFSFYTYYKTESKKSIEAAKAAMQKERARNSYYSLISILHSIDSIVQIPKKGEVTVEQLQDLARVARGQVYVLAKQLQADQNRLKNWKFGQLIESELNATELEVSDDENPSV